MTVLDTQGYPFFYGVGIYDSNTDEHRNLLKIQEAGQDIMVYDSDDSDVHFPVRSAHRTLAIVKDGKEIEGVLLPIVYYDSNHSGTLLAGYHVSGDDPPEPNAPLHLAGSGVVVHSDLYFLTGASLVSDEHYLTVQESISYEGKYLSQITVGPKVDDTNEESTQSTSDQLLTDGSESTLLTLETTASYTSGLRIIYAANLSEEGGRTAEFEVRLYNDSSGVGDSYSLVDSKSIRISDDSQYIYRVKYAGGVSSGELLQLRVYVDETHNQCVSYVRGSIIPTTIEITDT
jgi:hypothetical protein